MSCSASAVAMRQRELVHLLFVNNTTDEAVAKSMLRAHEAQMRRNARQRKQELRKSLVRLSLSN